MLTRRIVVLPAQTLRHARKFYGPGSELDVLSVEADAYIAAGKAEEAEAAKPAKKKADKPQTPPAS